jgi:hypothetical protein
MAGDTRAHEQDGYTDARRQIMLLLDGAFAVELLHRDPTHIETAGDAAANLIRGAVRG